MFALVGSFLGCALQAVNSRERIQYANGEEYNGMQRDEQELASPDELDENDRTIEEYRDGMNDNNDDGDDLDVEVKPADAFEDDDDDNDNQNDEELREYQR